MDGGNWLLLGGLVVTGAVLYTVINRLGAGKLWVPHFEGPWRVLAGFALALLLIGGLGMLIFAALSLPSDPGEIPATVADDETPAWAVAAAVTIAVGTALMVAAIVVGRRRTPTGNPAARAHRARR